MSEIRIDWMTDDTDCETCGTSYADGAMVYLDGELLLDLCPMAHCFGGAHYDDRQVLYRILDALGHTIAGNGIAETPA